MKWSKRAALLAAALAACTVDDGVLGGLDSDRGAAGSSGQSNECTSQGPRVSLREGSGTNGYETCTGRVAAAQFLNALCTCADARLGNFLQTRGFDSSRGAYQPGQADDSGASVGVNGAYVMAAGHTDVGGSLALAGADGPMLAGSLQVRGDFRCAGDVTVTGTANIARNAWLGGGLVGLGPVTIGGVLHHQESVLALPLTAGTALQEPVSVSKPCACEPQEQLDILGLVLAAKERNDNAAAGIRTNALAQIAAPTTLTLPCGRYFVDSVAGTGDVTLDVQGLAALFVAGSLDLSGALSVRLAPGAELDLFVAGEVQAGRITLASKERPAAGRLYVAGTAEMSLASPWIGNLYAPLARVSATAPLEVWGSIFAREFVSSASTSFVYDRAVLAAGSGCATPNPPAGSCSRCGWCSGGTACVDGLCGACRVDDDCCSQSVCANGSCQVLISVR
ncbi:MAG: DUF7305 domain-containing protein [Myxococcota bacterium]